MTSLIAPMMVSTTLMACILQSLSDTCLAMSQRLLAFRSRHSCSDTCSDIGRLRWWWGSRRGEDILRASGLGYTIVRPGPLLEEPGGYKALVFDQGNRIAQTISCADAADVALKVPLHCNLCTIPACLFNFVPIAVQSISQSMRAQCASNTLLLSSSSLHMLHVGTSGIERIVALAGFVRQEHYRSHYLYTALSPTKLTKVCVFAGKRYTVESNDLKSKTLRDFGVSRESRLELSVCHHRVVIMIYRSARLHSTPNH